MKFIKIKDFIRSNSGAAYCVVLASYFRNKKDPARSGKGSTFPPCSLIIIARRPRLLNEKQAILEGEKSVLSAAQECTQGSSFEWASIALYKTFIQNEIMTR